MPKRTFKGNKRKRAKKSGFRARAKSMTGQRVLKNRRAKGRQQLTATKKGKKV